MDFPIVNVLDVNSDVELDHEQIIDFGFECDTFQKLAFNSLHRGNDVLVNVCTGAGKTVVLEYAVAYSIMVLKKRSVVNSPIKSLSNQIYAGLKKSLGKYGITVGILTGDIKMDEDAQCVVLTSEILENSMYELNKTTSGTKKRLNTGFIDSIGVIVMDEAHYMNDLDRGQVYEKTLVLARQNIQLVLLSATLSSPVEFARFISSCHQKLVDLITVEKRKVPLKHYLLVPNSSLETLESSKSMHMFLDENNNYCTDGFTSAKYAHEKWIKERQKKGKSIMHPNTVYDTVKYLKDNDMLQAIFFAFSKKDCERYAQSINFEIINHDDRHEIETIFNHTMQPYMKRYENVGEVETVKNLLLRGVSYHHSGMLSILKEIVEIIFRKGLAKVLFCTETFAVGVNCPCRTVVFTKLKKYTREGERWLSTAEYKQISGRAGRRGLDTYGNVIVMYQTEFPVEGDIKNIVLGKIPKITSHFIWDYNFFLKIVQSNVTDIHRFFSKSLLNSENETILNGLKKERTILQEQICLLTSSINNLSDTTQAYVLVSYENKLNSNIFDTRISVSLPKKQQQEYSKLVKMLADPKFKEKYETIKKKIVLEKEMEKSNSIISGYESYVTTHYNKIQTILYRWGYVTTMDKTTLEKTDIDIKGIIASNINEVNCITLTEIICGNYLDGLTLEEIISFMSIFTEPIKSSDRFDRVQSVNYIGTLSLKNRIDRLFTMIEEKKRDEEIVFGKVFSNWDISTDYIDISYNWAKGASVYDTLMKLSEVEEHSGNFVKAMIKIDNIVNDVKSICEMIGKIEMLPILENADALILRDIVSVTSLYLK